MKRKGRLALFFYTSTTCTGKRYTDCLIHTQCFFKVGGKGPDMHFLSGYYFKISYKKLQENKNNRKRA
jgi:hypothetical protein